MSIPKFLVRWGYTGSQIIAGGWQLAQGHSTTQASSNDAIDTLLAYARAGITTFDCADIYTGVEELYGAFLARAERELDTSLVAQLRIHTKHVPDMSDILARRIDFDYVESLIDRSLKRLRKDRLDLVQFHHWDYEVPTYLEIMGHLDKLRRSGKIETIGVTNFNTSILSTFVHEGFEIISTQNQYSLIDRRPASLLAPFCVQNSIAIFAYGTLAGGLLTDKYFWVDRPQEPLENRSLRKYLRILDDWGDWWQFQNLLSVLREIAQSHAVSISDVAMRWTLEQRGVAGIILGTRHSKHAQALHAPFAFSLTAEEHVAIDNAYSHWHAIAWDCFDIERYTSRHKDIMKTNLNHRETTPVN